MPASLPVPHEPLPDDPDDTVERAEGAEIVEITKPPAKPRAKRPASPRKPRAPRASAQPSADPGPPPPLPPEFADEDDIIVPPRPPLPAAVGDDASADDAAPVVEEAAEPVAEATEVAPEPQADVEPPADEVEVEVAEPGPADPVEVEEIDEVEADAVASADVETEREPDVVASAAIETELEPQALDDGAEAALAAVFADAEGDASIDPTTAALLLRGVTKSFGDTRAVEGIDLTVPAGTFYGLVGPNGAGKTTTLSMIAGLLQPDRGLIRVGGVDAAAKPLEAKRQLGVLPDRLRTFD
ncbi:MAG: ATP-binding cassette domain-containing protein, partial [Microbacterium sp.]